MGETLTLEQQIANLRLLGEGATIRNGSIGSAVTMLAGLLWFFLAGGQTAKVLALFVAGCAALALLAYRMGAPGLRHAAAATRRGRRVPARIVLLPGIDQDDRTGDLRGTLRPDDAHHPAWQMQVRPQGWRPPEGLLQVEAVYLGDIAWPVLLVHPDGVLVPQGRPQRAA